jgi:hypothetical protein
LQWDDGSSAAIAGGDEGSEAVATIRKDGLVLLRGRAWITGRRGFVIILPDGRYELVSLDENQVAAEALGQRGFIGVRHGAITSPQLGGKSLKEKNGITSAGEFRWEWERDSLSGTFPIKDRLPSDWAFSGEISWRDLNDTARIVLVGDGGLELRIIPGLVVVLAKGQEVQRLTLPGSPLLSMHLSLRQSEAKNLTVAVDDLSLTVPLTAPIGGYRLHIDGGAMVKVDAFHALPTPRPTAPVNGW